MITKNNYYSQFKTFPQKELQWKTCGICAVAMVLDAEKKFDKFKNQKNNLERFLKDLVNLHQNGKPVYKKKFTLAGETALITTVTSTDNNSRELIYAEADKKFFPVFNLMNGYDHRSSKKIFGDFKLSAELVENISQKKIKQKFKSKDWKYFLASIHSLKGRGSHVVVIQNFGKDELGDYIEIVDPAETSFELGLKRIDLPFFEKIFNGFGTFIKN